MSALRKSADLQSVKTRHLVVQNEDGTFPPAYSLIATDAKGLGVTEWVQDISMNSVTLFGSTEASAGVLTYSDVSGLLLNSVPFAGGGSGSIGATGPVGSAGSAGATGSAGSAGSAGATGPVGSAGSIGATGPAGSAGSAGATGPAGPAGATGSAGSIGATGLSGLLAGLTSANAGSGIDISGTPVNPIIGLSSLGSVDSVPTSPSVEALALAYNELLFILNGKIITVNSLPSVTPIGVTASARSANLSWNLVGSGYSYTVYLNDISQSPVTSGNTYTLIGLTPSTSYSVAVSSNNSIFFSPPISRNFMTESDLRSYDIYNDSRTAKTPSSPTAFTGINTAVLVSNTSNNIWSSLSDLTLVNQIVRIELEFYSGLSILSGGGRSEFTPKRAEAQLFFSRDAGATPSPLNNYFIFEANYNRVNPQSADIGWSAVGSSIGGGDPGEVVTNPNTPITIAYSGNETLFQRMFGNGGSTIDRSTGIQFYWIYYDLSFPYDVYINNCQLNAFTIYYNV